MLFQKCHETMELKQIYKYTCCLQEKNTLTYAMINAHVGYIVHENI